jgi:hypothetical protein
VKLAGIRVLPEVEPSQAPFWRQIFTSRAGSVTTRLASCAVATLVAQARRENQHHAAA